MTVASAARRGLLPLLLILMIALCAGAQPAHTPAPTWATHVAPILFRNCTSCHHPGGAGPFSLLTYADARRWAPQMLAVTQSRYMPPWLPEPGHGDFADNRRLSAADLAKIARWVHAGMLEGDPAQAPSAPRYSPDWELGPPDLVLVAAQPLSVPAEGQDVFHNFILPANVTGPRYIRAVQILPGNPRVVHHANILIDRTAELRRQHAADWQAGVPGMETTISSGDRFDPDSQFLFWKPDSPAIALPPGMALRLDPGTDLVLNTHLKPTGRAETVTPRIGIYFTDQPPTRSPMLLQLEHDSALDIPGGESHFQIDDQFRLPIAVNVLGIYPHAHYLGKQMEAWATEPSGVRTPLLLIRDWDIDRQSVYAYRRPLLLPAGSVLHMRYVYDNSAANPRNPANPPVRVRAGNRSVDEMGHLWLQVLPAQPFQRDARGHQSDARMVLQRAWMQHRLERNPADRIAAYNLASLDVMSGSAGDALHTFERLAQQTPNDARVHTSLGVAQEQSGDWQSAAASYQHALDLEPTQTDARYDLASLELRHDQAEAAAQNYRALLQQHPDDAAAHGGMGAALAQQNQPDAARAEFEKALLLEPAQPVALEGYGTLELAGGDLEHARALLTRAVAAGARDAAVWQKLAFACAQTGREAEAEQALRSAMEADPRDPTSHALLGQLLAARGDLTQAIAEQRSALKLSDKDPDGWSNLGALEARASHPAAARQAFEHALQLDPNHAAARANLLRLGAPHLP